MEKYVGYIRTSTGRQILGLEEQRSRINQFIEANGDELVDIISEQETGKNNYRDKLNLAINLCTKFGYTLLFTKLDRLSREVEFLFTLRNKGVKLKCIELPELNTLTLGIFGTVAQFERESISIRTKNGLRELSKTKKLGTPSNLTLEAKKKGLEAIKKNRIENENWRLAKTYIEHFQMKNGYTSLTEISKELNLNGYRTRRGCSFSPEIVRRLIAQ
ncbi:recombinase family protein [Flavobacterium sp.]|jgi:DNA invertase Pin-like site-specific DNA recombinase|uniref:recombinase family protein n=1 Tax=Flavobacterium sp. TaxID=239 RepID=UPI0037BF4D1B